MALKFISEKLKDQLTMFFKVNWSPLLIYALNLIYTTTNDQPQITFLVVLGTLTPCVHNITIIITNQVPISNSQLCGYEVMIYEVILLKIHSVQETFSKHEI